MSQTDRRTLRARGNEEQMTPKAFEIVESCEQERPPQVLTIRQPFAEQIIRGEKKVENRKWATTYRGLLLIHAGATTSEVNDDDLDRYPEMMFGGIVGGCILLDCVEYKRLGAAYPQLRGNRYASGPFCWVLDRPFRLDFHAMKGRLGLGKAPDELLDALGIEFG